MLFQDKTLSQIESPINRSNNIFFKELNNIDIVHTDSRAIRDSFFLNKHQKNQSLLNESTTNILANLSQITEQSNQKVDQSYVFPTITFQNPFSSNINNSLEIHDQTSNFNSSQNKNLNGSTDNQKSQQNNQVSQFSSPNQKDQRVTFGYNLDQRQNQKHFLNNIQIIPFNNVTHTSVNNKELNNQMYGSSAFNNDNNSYQNYLNQPLMLNSKKNQKIQIETFESQKQKQQKQQDQFVKQVQEYKKSIYKKLQSYQQQLKNNKNLDFLQQLREDSINIQNQYQVFLEENSNILIKTHKQNPSEQSKPYLFIEDDYLLEKDVNNNMDLIEQFITIFKDIYKKINKEPEFKQNQQNSQSQKFKSNQIQVQLQKNSQEQLKQIENPIYTINNIISGKELLSISQQSQCDNNQTYNQQLNYASHNHDNSNSNNNVFNSSQNLNNFGNQKYSQQQQSQSQLQEYKQSENLGMEIINKLNSQNINNIFDNNDKQKQNKKTQSISSVSTSKNNSIINSENKTTLYCTICDKYYTSLDFIYHNCEQNTDYNSKQLELNDETILINDNLDQFLKKVNSKIEKIKDNVQQNLSQEKLPFTKNILNETLDMLNIVFQSSDLKVVKKILQKLEKQSLLLSQDTMQSKSLYQYIKKIEQLLLEKKQYLDKSFILNEVSTINENVHQALQTENDLQKKIQNKKNFDLNIFENYSCIQFQHQQLFPSTTQNTQIQRSTLYFPTEQSNQTINTQRQLHSYKQSQVFQDEQLLNNYNNFTQNKNDQNIFLNDHNKIDYNSSNVKVKFYDLVSKFKLSLPDLHSGKSVLISSVFQQAKQANISPDQWIKFIEKQLMIN